MGRGSSAPCFLTRSRARTSRSGGIEVPDAVDLIRAKRDGLPLAEADIAWLIDAYTRGGVADEQISAMAMAIFFRALGPARLRPWTNAMIGSGQRLHPTSVPAPTVVKQAV